ncbi:MAG: inorganic phosphate transporter [Candidatus Heimdallarchaeota archaeon]
MVDPLITLTGISMLLAIAIGANDETFAPVVGSKRLTVNQAVSIGGIIVVIGAVTIGYNVAKTVGNDIAESPFTEMQILSILFSVSALLILGSWKGLPLSTTHTMVGSTVALSLILGESVDWSVITKIIASWFISPVAGFVGSYLLMKAIIKFKKTYIKGLDDVDRLESLFANGLIVAVVITAFSRGGNDVSNAVAPLIQSYFELATSEGVPLLERLPLLLAGICMAIGLVLIGRRVLKTLGNDVVELSPTTAVAVQASTALVTFIAAFVGIPISGTHVLVAAFVGTGWASGTNVNMDTVKRIGVSAVGTPFAAALTTFVLWSIVSVAI